MYTLRSLLRSTALFALSVAISVRGLSPNPKNGHWVDSWVSMPQLTETDNLPPSPFTQPTVIFNDSTIRQTVHFSTGAKQIRLRISNAFGATDLPITSAAIGLPVNGTAGSNALAPGSLQKVTFSGNSSIIIPNGALAVSDPIEMDVQPQSMLLVDMFLEAGQAGNNITSHPGSRTTSWFVEGNQLGVPIINASSVEHWYFLSAVEAWSPPTTRSFVVVGDSITDGRGSTTNGNDRWPDQLLNRTQSSPSTSSIAIVNQAAGGNRILADGLGPNAIGRIERDVLSHPNVGFVMIFEGVNDIGTFIPDVVPRLIQAYQQIITRVHTDGLPMFAATITPFFGNAYFTNETEAQRQEINEWIRTSGKFDAVIDFDKVVRDPTEPQMLNPAFDSGDGLHPNPAGYKAMADAFDLTLFEKFSSGVNSFE